ncbi:30S ribosome-binding factor RbfA [Planctomycetota bacterium]
MSVRLERVSKAMKQEIGQLISQEMNDPRIGFTTVTRVEVAADIRSAKVYVGVIGDERTRKGTMIGLTNASGYIQREIASRLRMKYTPTLSFFMDDGPATSVRISKLLAEVTPKTQEDETDEQE